MPGPREGKNTRIRVVGGTVHFSFENPQNITFAERISHYGRRAKDMSPVFDEYGPYMLRSIDRNFQAEGRPDRWARLAPATIQERIRLGFGRGPILQRTKKLRRGFRTESGKRTFRIKNIVDYFAHHQYGAPKANIPMRRMVVLLVQDRAQFTRIARKHLGVTDD